jgi:hypothetical protein
MQARQRPIRQQCRRREEETTGDGFGSPMVASRVALLERE